MSDDPVTGVADAAQSRGPSGSAPQAPDAEAQPHGEAAGAASSREDEVVTPSNHVKSMSGRIFSSMLAFVLMVLIAFAGVITAIFFNSYEHSATDALERQAEQVAHEVAGADLSQRVALLDVQSDSVRYTLVAPDGAVLYDNEGDFATMGNHADRPEVRAASDAGRASSSRFSETLSTDTLYAAVRLPDDSVLRLSETRHSIMAFLQELLGPILALLLVAAALCYFVSRLLARKIMQPINALDFREPLHNDIYEEMNPLLVRIDDQQRQLIVQNTELAQAHNMRRDFSSNVSHEMKTPLQVISGYAELLRNGVVAEEDKQRFASLIYDEAQSMRLLIDDVLTLSRLDESALDDTAVRIDLFTSAISMSERLDSLAKEAAITVSVDGQPTWIMGSQTLVEEMLYNLIENGIRYNTSEGSVHVEVGSEDGQACVRVSDTGPGIAEDCREKIFERFFRIDKSRSKKTGGTGLGLAIVKHAVIYHGGTIEVLDSPSGGTTFEVRIPLAS